jgi:hypothetical protein
MVDTTVLGVCSSAEERSGRKTKTPQVLTATLSVCSYEGKWSFGLKEGAMKYSPLADEEIFRYQNYYKVK